MKVELDLADFGHLREGREYCLACGSAPQGELEPGTLVYYALRHRVCDSCANRGEEYLRKAIEEHAERLRREAAAFEKATAEGVEVPEISLEERAKMELWAERQVKDRFGVCPVCGVGDLFLNVGRTHWFCCEEHEVTWFVGANLFSSWRHEDEETWRKNEEKLKGYRVVYHKDASADLDLIPTGEALRAAEERVSAGSPSDFEDFPF
jgi:hypothetical protein